MKGAKRVREVVLDSASSWVGVDPGRTPASTMVLKLFNDLVVTGALESAISPGAGRRVLRGHIQGEDGSYFLLACESNVVAGSIFIPHRGSFQIHYSGSGIHSIIESDPAQLPPCGVQNGAFKGTKPGLFKAAEMEVQKNQAEVVAGAKMPVVDILVIYTAQARDGAGGQAGIDTLIDLAVAEANMVYQNSQVNLFLHLAKSAKVTYEESGNLADDLARLINPRDGYLDEVGALRTNCHADLVCMIVENSTPQSGFDLTGIAVQTANATNAFSVVQRYFATGSYVFAHELGHNFGCQHDRADANSPGIYHYSYGNVFQAQGWTYGTVMSYPGQRIPHFSNPNVSFLGAPTGIGDAAINAADNARTLNLRAATVAGFCSPSGSTYAPTVSISNPRNNAVLFTRSNIVVSANAAETGG
ncbi:MAG TPA: M12 family metallo-peptidase, partial [Verrucomicrobiae bacterium]|nr:M12 family metallo-peptidase [Verrucomicrobiae bacterium]